MNNFALIGASALLILTTACSPALAGRSYNDRERQHFTDTARVISAVPIYRTVRIAEPREECYEKQVHYRDDDYKSATPMIAGGVVGGIVGNQFGHGNGKTFMTIAGTVLGGSIGRDIGHRNQSYSHYGPQTETHCEMVHGFREEEQLEGYRVTYRYQGKKFTTSMPYDPGKRLKLNVNILPYE